MADKMSKEEAKKEFHRWLGKKDPSECSLFDYKVHQKVNQLIDSIESEPEKVKLPKKVGEQWDKLVSKQSFTDTTSRVDNALGCLGTNITDGTELYKWFRNTKDSYSLLVDAARYGWVPIDERYRVKVPLLWTGGAQVWWAKLDIGLAWVGDSMFNSGDDGFNHGTFTMKEINQYSLQDFERELVTPEDFKEQ